MGWMAAYSRQSSPHRHRAGGGVIERHRVVFLREEGRRTMPSNATAYSARSAEHAAVQGHVRTGKEDQKGKKIPQPCAVEFRVGEATTHRRTPTPLPLFRRASGAAEEWGKREGWVAAPRYRGFANLTIPAPASSGASARFTTPKAWAGD